MDFKDITLYPEGSYVNKHISNGILAAIYNFFTAVINAILAVFRWIRGIGASVIILSVLFFIVINFYIFSSIVSLDSFFYSFLFLSLLTDGLYVLVHLPRSKVEHGKLSFNPYKLTVVIACYNGEKIIRETIRQAATHVPLNQIIVVSDASTDRTSLVAKKMGVKVIQNRKNMNKAFSISIAMKYVHTPYVLILDDDTYIEKTFIPTSLLDDGYDAVAFNVMPVKEKGLINELQQFEYRQSMELGKDVRAKAGAIGNISGAIGLFRTKDLVEQVTRHSGQFAGEDEQRTLLVHLSNTGKGITYTDAIVETRAPARYLDLYRQRAYNWSTALPELTPLYWKILLTPRYHYLLKSEKAYQLYIFLTDPLRILFFWVFFVKSTHLLFIYGFYLALNLAVWLKLGAKNSMRSVIFFPIYSLGLIICRFIGHFYWLYIKFKYLSKGLYRYVHDRRLLWEYSFVFAVLVVSWTISSRHFVSDVNLFNKIKSNHLEDISGNFSYDKVAAYGTVPTVPVPSAPADASYFMVPVDKGDTQRAIAYKAIIQYLEQNSDITSLQKEHSTAYTWLATQIPSFNSNQPGLAIHVDKSIIVQALNLEQGGTT